MLSPWITLFYEQEIGKKVVHEIIWDLEIKQKIANQLICHILTIVQRLSQSKVP